MSQWSLQTPQGEVRFANDQELLQHVKTQVFDLLARSALSHPVIRDEKGALYDLTIDIGLTKVG